MTTDAYRIWRDNPIEDRPYLSVVIPSYDEEWRILPTIGAIASHVSSLGFPWELIIADDGSTDTTVELVKNLNLTNATVLEATANGGKGSAVRRGVLASRGELVLFADADQSTPIEQLSMLIQGITDDRTNGGPNTGLKRGYDIVVGSRAAEGAEETKKSAVRKLMSGGLRFITSNVLRLGVKDTQCGFKLFTASAAHDLFSRQLIDGFSFDLEVLYLARRAGLHVKEVPVEWIDAPGSTVDAGKVAVRFFLDLAKILVNDCTHKYRQPPAERLERDPDLESQEQAWTSTSTPQMARRTSD